MTISSKAGADALPHPQDSSTDINPTQANVLMSENQHHQQQTNVPVFSIQRIYLKDLSLEVPGAPQVFLQSEAPQIEVSLDVTVNPIAQALFEVSVSATITSKIKEQIVFLVEGVQSGMFELRDIPADQIDAILGIVCPGIVYPYLRANIADALTRATFPPIHLAEINFQSFHEQRLAEAAKSRAAISEESSAGSDVTSSSIILPGNSDLKH